MQENKVTIEPDELGNVVRQSKNNPDYGYVRITQDRVSFTATGWVKSSKLSTLIHGTMEDLETLGIAKRKNLAGQIVVKESTNAFSTDDPDRDLKIAGDTGVICCSHGEPIYRKTFYDPSGTQEDELVAHTNGDAIKEIQSAGTAAEKADTKANAVKLSKEQLDAIKEDIDEKTEEVEEAETVEVDEKDDSFEL
jgi:hypothetical protein